jgi:PAT family beta-lactamase induction signal transducer AmpG
VSTVSQATTATTSGFRLDPKISMFILGFVSGLPYVVFTGTIAAWLADFDITAKAIGVYAMASLPYAFKFLWSPAINAATAPLVRRLGAIGRLRSWIILCLAIIAPVMLLLPVLDPQGALGLIAGLSLIGVFASATQDIAIAGWRIGIARDEKELDTLTTVEQFAYRISTFFGAAAALVIAQNFGWNTSWWLIAALFTVCFLAVFFVPDAAIEDEDGHRGRHITLGGNVPEAMRQGLLLPVLATWGLSLAIVFGFMFYLLAIDPSASTRFFTSWIAPVIAIACVAAPVLAATRITSRSGADLHTDIPVTGFKSALYINLLEPFVDLVHRLRWGLLSFLFLVLFYRYADAVWGSLAYPFYLGAPEVNGGLGHSLAEVAAASKVFGVVMTTAGIALGGILMATIGQMPALLLGAILASITNLLYADLAAGGSATDSFVDFVHLDVVFPAMNALVNLLSPAEDVVVGDSLGRLMVVIGAENLALGLASVVYVAYLSSVVNKRYAAVQYAILASLSMLVATLTKPILGELADERGFVFVFVLTAVLGLLGVLGTIIEWVRVRHAPPRATEGTVEA